MSKHARVNDDHAADDHDANHVVVMAWNDDDFPEDNGYIIYRPIKSGMIPWQEIVIK